MDLILLYRAYAQPLPVRRKVETLSITQRAIAALRAWFLEPEPVTKKIQKKSGSVLPLVEM